MISVIIPAYLIVVMVGRRRALEVLPAIVAAESRLAVVAQSHQRGDTLRVVRGQLQCLPVKTEGIVHRGPAPGGRPGLQGMNVGAGTYLLVLRVVVPRANLPCGGLQVVERDELDEFLPAVACRRLDPGTGLGVSADTPGGGQAGVGDIADQHVLERVLGAVAQRRTGVK